MTDPVTTAVATALATKAVAGLTEAGKAAFAALTRLVRRKLAASRQSSEVLLRAETYPESDIHRKALAEVLAQDMAADRSFAEQLAHAWRQLQEAGAATSLGTVHNVVSGTVEGNVVQARNVHGDVTFR